MGLPLLQPPPKSLPHLRRKRPPCQLPIGLKMKRFLKHLVYPDPFRFPCRTSLRCFPSSSSSRSETIHLIYKYSVLFGRLMMVIELSELNPTYIYICIVYTIKNKHNRKCVV